MKYGFRWVYWNLDNTGMPTTGASHWKAKCLEFNWGYSVWVLFVGKIEEVVR